jgi:hypothetical protein
MTRVLGWCITGHHDECLITVADLTCDCECHKGDESDGEK